MRYRKKPVVIEAVQFLRTDAIGGYILDGGSLDKGHIPEWFTSSQLTEKPSEDLPFPAGKWWADLETDCLYIGTLESLHIASPGDWIIQGVAGEIYPCKPDIFDRTYDRA